MKKRKQNKDKLKSLGLVPKTPPPQQTIPSRKTATPKRSPRNISRQEKKKEPPKKRTRQTRKIFEDNNCVKLCTCDHKDISSYKEETDKRYFQEDGELFNTSCATCGVLFRNSTSKGGDAVYVPDSNNPAYFCIGRWKFCCQHGHCRSCYLELLMPPISTRPRRNR